MSVRLETDVDQGQLELEDALRVIGKLKEGACSYAEKVKLFLEQAVRVVDLFYRGESMLEKEELRGVLKTHYATAFPEELTDFERRMEWAWKAGFGRSYQTDPTRPLKIPPALLTPTNGDGQASAPKTLPYKRVFDLPRLDPSRDIVRGLLGPRELVLWWGEPSAAKTMGAVALCGSIVSGEPFLGLEVQHTGSVVFVCGEGRAGIRNRFEAWMHGLSEKTRRAVTERVFVLTAAPNLLNESQAELLVATVEDIHKNYGPVLLVVLDTIASLTPGADENKQEAGTSVIALARTIGEKTDGASVLANHHGKKDGSEYRGSSTLGGGFDVILKSAKTGAGFELHVRKQKDREVPPDGWAFKADVVTLDPGKDPNGRDTVRSVRVGSITRADGKIDRDVGLETTLGRVADALVAAGAPGAESYRRDLDLGVVLFLASGPRRFGEIVAACKALSGELDTPKALQSKIGRVLARMSKKGGYLVESGPERGRTYALADAGRNAFSGALDALKNLPSEEPQW